LRDRPPQLSGATGAAGEITARELDMTADTPLRDADGTMTTASNGHAPTTSRWPRPSCSWIVTAATWPAAARPAAGLLRRLPRTSRGYGTRQARRRAGGVQVVNHQKMRRNAADSAHLIRLATAG
jgi:hypothetical protein